jgi:peptide methionine sulfoxide reductase MsrA
VIEGYSTQTPLVSGTMPARDEEVTVIYVPRKVMHRRVMQMVFEEYDTPLGVGSQNLDVGECIE